MNDHYTNVILGAGLTGLSAAYHLKKDYVVIEKLHEPGGLARSEEINGFIFDYAPHILYTVDPYATEFIQTMLKGNLHIQKRQAYIYHGKYDMYTQFPYQAHLYGLPAEDIIDCLNGLVEVMRNPDRPEPKNYEEWIYWRFGKGIAEHLMIPYSERIWTISTKEMNFDWIARRVPEPDFEAILRGALTDETKLAGFNKDFWYPIEGGIEALPSAMAQQVDNINLNTTVTKIDPKSKKVELNGDTWVGYEKLIYTLSLTHLPNFIDDIPQDVRDAIAGLKHNKIECVNIGIDRPDISPYQWCYLYEDDFIFHRISFPRSFSEKTCPPGTSSVCCEIAHSDYRPLKVRGKEAIIQQTIDDLIKAKMVRPDDKILAADMLAVDPAYVIYDLNYHQNVDTIHKYLRALDIYPQGRFGEWQYFNMDHSVLSGKRVADELNG